MNKIIGKWKELCLKRKVKSLKGSINVTQKIRFVWHRYTFSAWWMIFWGRCFDSANVLLDRHLLIVKHIRFAPDNLHIYWKLWLSQTEILHDMEMTIDMKIVVNNIPLHKQMSRCRLYSFIVIMENISWLTTVLTVSF